MTKVLNTYDQFFANPVEVRQYLRQEIARMDYELAMENREKRGIEKGIKEATEKNALAFIKEGLAKEKVFSILKMTSDEIADFLNKHKDL